LVSFREIELFRTFPDKAVHKYYHIGPYTVRGLQTTLCIMSMRVPRQPVTYVDNHFLRFEAKQRRK